MDAPAPTRVSPKAALVPPLGYSDRVSMISIYVGNLTYNVTEDELREYFQQHGEVQRIHLVTDRETGRPRGFGFVEMDDDGGRAAIEALNGKDFQGRPLTINEARPREERGGGFPGEAQWAAY